MSDSQRPHGLQPTRLLHTWDFQGKSTGVGCHRLLQRITADPLEYLQLVEMPHHSLVSLHYTDHQLVELTQTLVDRVSDAIQPSHPLWSPSPPAFNLSQQQGLLK